MHIDFYWQVGDAGEIVELTYGSNQIIMRHRFFLSYTQQKAAMYARRVGGNGINQEKILMEKF